jgi:hypothetical protein
MHVVFCLCNTGQVSADDCRLSSIPISYYLIKEDSLLPFPFAVDPLSGSIKVIDELDRERKSFYKFHISLFNSTIQTEIQINILDENDHYPIFDKPHEQYIYISKQNNDIFITHIHATDADDDINGLVNYYFTNQELYNYFHLYPNGSIVLYNLNNIDLPIRLEIYARDQGYPKALNSKENLVIYICDIFARNECPSNRFQRHFFIGSIVIMICVVLFLLIIIMCIVWNLFIKERLTGKGKNSSYNYRIGPRKSLSNEV